VKQALRPFNPDPVEVREALLGAFQLGFDPSDLYLRAVQGRPEEWDPPPPLSKVLPEDVLGYLDGLEERGLEEELKPPSPEDEEE
jgi:hypothetical protein